MLIRMFLISIIAWIRRIFLFSLEKIFLGAKQNMPKILGKGLQDEEQKKIGNLLSSVRGGRSLTIVEWIHLGHVPWVRNFFVEKN